MSATIEILDSQPTVILGSNSTANATDAQAQSQAAVSAAIDQTARLNSLANQVASLANAGNMNSLGGIPVLGLSLDVPPPPAAVTAALNATASNSTNSTGGGSAGSAFTPIAPITVVFPSATPTVTPSQAPTPSQTLSLGASPSTTSTATSTASATPSSTTLFDTATAASSASTTPLSSGALAGIVIGCVVAVGLAVAILFFSRPRRTLKVTPSDEGDAARPGDAAGAAPALDPTNMEREPGVTSVTVFKTPKPGAGGFDLLKGPELAHAGSAVDLRAPRRSSNCDLEPVVHAEAAPAPSAPPGPTRLSPPRPGDEALAASAPHLESPAAANGIVAAAAAQRSLPV